MKVLFSVGKAYAPIRDSFVSSIEKLGAEVTCLYEGSTKNEKAAILESIEDAQIYITAVAPADREVIDAARDLQYIIKTGTGVDNIDVAYASQKGIMVSNAPGANAASVAELVIGLMISLSREIPRLDRNTKSGAWVRSPGTECHGKTLGLIGFGSIGKKVAKHAGTFDMNIVAYGHYKDYETAKNLGVTFVTFDQLLSEADYIVVSTSLKKSNYHLIDKNAIGRMKHSACLINISRGAIIDGDALYHALEQGVIRGAALDVFEIEPPAEVPEQLDNLIVTPHIGGTTLESAHRIARVTVDNIHLFMTQQPVQHVMNQKELQAAKGIG